MHALYSSNVMCLHAECWITAYIEGQGACEAKPQCCYSPVQPNPSNLPWCIVNGAGPSPPPPTTCSGERRAGYDVPGNPQRVANPIAGATQDECCAACTANPQCDVWIWATPSHSNGGDNCWQVKGVDVVVASADRVTGVVHGPFPPLPPPPPPPPPQMVFSLESNASSASGTVKYYGTSTPPSHRHFVSSRTLNGGAADPVMGSQGSAILASSRVGSKLPRLC